MRKLVLAAERREAEIACYAMAAGFDNLADAKLMLCCGDRIPSLPEIMYALFKAGHVGVYVEAAIHAGKKWPEATPWVGLPGQNELRAVAAAMPRNSGMYGIIETTDYDVVYVEGGELYDPRDRLHGGADTVGVRRALFMHRAYRGYNTQVLLDKAVLEHQRLCQGE